MSNTIDEWVVIVSHMGLRDPKAATILFYPSKVAAEDSILMDREHQQGQYDAHVLMRFDELPDWVQHKAAAASTLDLGDTKVKHVAGLGGKTFGSVWVEYSPDEDGRAFEEMIKEKARGHRD